MATEVIDFDGITGGVFASVNTPYIEDGVRLSPPPQTEFLSFLPGHGLTTGSPYAYPASTHTIFTLEPVASDVTLALLGIDVIEISGSSNHSIDFIGTRTNGTTLTETIVTDGVKDTLSDNGAPDPFLFQSLAAEGFASISFASTDPSVGFDNIRVGLVQPVPEPATGWLLVGLGLATSVRLRKRPRRC